MSMQPIESDAKCAPEKYALFANKYVDIILGQCNQNLTNKVIEIFEENLHACMVSILYIQKTPYADKRTKKAAPKLRQRP